LPIYLLKNQRDAKKEEFYCQKNRDSIVFTRNSYKANPQKNLTTKVYRENKVTKTKLFAFNSGKLLKYLTY